MKKTDLTPLTEKELDALDALNLDIMGGPALRMLLERVRLTYPVLEAQEPEDDETEEYLLWQENLETLDDYLDELTERIAEENHGN